ncbi:MAG: glycosyltransferase [Planctomycetota bacterium]
MSGDRLVVDRDFHAGMLGYLARLGPSVGCLVPEVPMLSAFSDLEPLELPIAEIPYAVRTLDGRWNRDPLPSVRVQLHKHLADAELVVGAQGSGIPRAIFDAATRRGLPVVPIVETNRRVALDRARRSVWNPLRGLVRLSRARAEWRVVTDQVRRATAVQCNGYLAYFGFEGLNERRLLYLDSRLHQHQVLDAERIAQRVQSLATPRPLELLFVGPFERVYGPLEIVRVGIELHRRGVPFRLRMLGCGGHRRRMRRIIRRNGAARSIQLAEVTDSATLAQAYAETDLLLSCQPREDTVCEYIEAMGRGVPVLGFNTSTWRAVANASGAGIIVPVGAVGAAARELIELAGDTERLLALSLSARRFAAEHSFEEEWRKRCDHLAAFYHRAEPLTTAASTAAGGSEWVSLEPAPP